MKPLKNAKQSERFWSGSNALWRRRCRSFLAVAVGSPLFAFSCRAQEPPLEIAIRASSFNTYYQENFADPFNDNSEEVDGNSWSILSLDMGIAYRVPKTFPAPLLLMADWQAPAILLKGLEIGNEYPPNGITQLTQQEHVKYNNFWGKIVVGWELLPFLNPYVGFVWSDFTAERTGQLDGTANGTLTPDPNQDYTERISATYYCLGLQGTVPFRHGTDYLIRYDADLELPNHVSVTNDYFGSGSWGQGTTGYAVRARAELDIPFFTTPFKTHYVTIGASVALQKWNGDGRTGIVWNGDYSQTVTWPRNFSFEAGGYIGLTQYF